MPLTAKEETVERKYWYDEILANLGFFGPEAPPAWAHNMAVLVSNQHIILLRLQDRADNIERLKDLARVR